MFDSYRQCITLRPSGRGIAAVHERAHACCRCVCVCCSFHKCSEWRVWYGVYLATRGRKEEAARESRRALDLDPLSPWINTDLGDILRFARQYDQAIEQHQKTIALEPNFWIAHFCMGWAYLHKGDPSAAIAAFEKARSLDDDPSVLAGLGLG